MCRADDSKWKNLLQSLQMNPATGTKKLDPMRHEIMVKLKRKTSDEGRKERGIRSYHRLCQGHTGPRWSCPLQSLL